MGPFQRELAHRPRKEFVPPSRAWQKPFDVETTFVEVTRARKNRGRKYHGPDSPLYSAIYPLVCITKVFGLAPYDFTADQMTPSNVCLVFSLAFMGIYCRIMYVVYLNFIAHPKHKPVLGVVETTKVIVNYSVAVYELVSTMFTRRAFCGVWNGLQDFDERLSQLGYPRRETRVKIVAWTYLIGQTIVWTMINQSGMYAFTETWVFNVSYMCIYIATACSVCKFFGMVSFLGQRFHQLNRIARENLPATVGYRSSNVSRKTIQDLHNQLMLFGEALASLYSWSLLFWLGNLSVHSVCNLYFIIDCVILTSCSSITWPQIFNMWVWLIEFIIQFLSIHIACDYTITEANSMGAIIVEWDRRVLVRFPYEDSIRASLYFLNRRLRFPAGGLFNVNLLLLCSIVGVLSTYLVILLQLPG